MITFLEILERIFAGIGIFVTFGILALLLAAKKCTATIIDDDDEEEEDN